MVKYYFNVRTKTGDIVSLASKGTDEKEASENLLNMYKNVEKILSTSLISPVRERIKERRKKEAASELDKAFKNKREFYERDKSRRNLKLIY